MKNINNLKELTKTELKILAELHIGYIRNYYTGSGRWSRKYKDYVQEARELLEKLKINKRYICIGNDAPKNGWQGNYIVLTGCGKSLKIVKAAYEIIHAEEKKKADKLLARNKEFWLTKLKNLCQERLVSDISKNHKKSLNGQIRVFAALLQIDCPEEQKEYLEFIEKYAKM